MSKIPPPVIAILTDNLPDFTTHPKLNSLFMYADAPGDPPDGSKAEKTLEWLRRINDTSDRPLEVLGKLIEGFMEIEEDEAVDTSLFGVQLESPAKKFKDRIEAALKRYNLRYMQGGHISDGSSAPSRSLAQLIQGRDLPAIEIEFNRALENVHTNPREAVSAACNILESIFKFYIADEELERPTKQDLQGLWKVVRADLGFDPSSLEDDDLRKIVSGIFSVVDGIGAFRTHASSAHGQGRKMYIIQPRHARLAIHSAHSVALYVMESWDHKKATRNA
ncbi:abortive infection family protein [Salinicola sp. RZ23]|uniref:abortive infection family protein n=1 Tax=Salinicola sp. RZ23 TaxID=1949087 RepID=UPI000DA15A21|nr:abortive infection family protein [Salinicola sp. RZ23]